jgi:hypothetical protein
MKRFALVGLIAALGLVAGSCGGNSTLDDTEAVVVVTVEIDEYNPDIDICLTSGFDVTINDMSISSESKSPTTVVGNQQDVNLTRWVITPYRTDGGNEASPEWSHDLAVYVPALGTTTLENYRVYPAENFRLPPLSYLLPENGGFDPETGNRNIRQSLRLQIFGRTVSGKAVATEPIPIAFNFFCLSP